MSKIVFKKIFDNILCEIIFDPTTQIAEVKANGKVYFEFEVTIKNIHDHLVQECAFATVYKDFKIQRRLSRMREYRKQATKE